MELIFAMFEDLLKHPEWLRKADIEEIEAVIDDGEGQYPVRIIRKVSWEGKSITVVINGQVIYGYDYEHILPEERTAISKYFIKIGDVLYRYNDNLKKASMYWFTNRYKPQKNG